jgi:hypothetical protein
MTASCVMPRGRLMLCFGILLMTTICLGFNPSTFPAPTRRKPTPTPGRMPALSNFMSSRGQESTRQPQRRREENGGPANKDFDEGIDSPVVMETPRQIKEKPSPVSLWNELKSLQRRFKLPPVQVDDPQLLLYDVFLLVNLSVSISFWVVHRLQLEYVALAFNEGCLLSILWIVAGLYHGVFLGSAVDGHQRPNSMYSIGNTDEETRQQQSEHPWWEILFKENNKGGPSSAGLLALTTFINTISLRLIVAFVVAVAEHRPVFEDPLEQLIPLEVGFGLILMSSWRTIHSAFTPRI